MGVQLNGFGGNCLGRANATADTAFYAVVPGRRNAFARVVSFQNSSGNTANLNYWMRPLGRANTTAAYTTSDSAIVVDADPSPTGNTIAAGDQVVIEHSDGTYRRSQVNTAGWNSTSKTITFTTTLPAAVASGAKVFNFGVFGDTDPVDGLAHPSFASVANTVTTYNLQGGGIKGRNAGDPLLFYCPNATNATVLNYAEYNYTLE